MIKHALGIVGTAAMLLASHVQAQQAPPPGGPSPEMLREMREAEARNNAMPDTPGTGDYPAIKEADPTLANHVVYRPADLSKLAGRKLGILAWGNGGCGDDGANSRQHLAEIASHGYLVIANGTIKSGPGVPPAPPLTIPAPGPDGARRLPPPRTSAEMLTQSIDWAIAENGRADSPYFGKIDTSAVAVSGWSCGGLQALAIAAADPRVKTAVIHNSGIFNQPMPGMGVNIDKATLDRVKVPLLYILGGPTDIAYANGMDDFARLTATPVAVANLGVGHGGTFYQRNGGKAAALAVAWFDWKLRNDAAAGKWFAGPDCRLCRDPEWKFQQKGL